MLEGAGDTEYAGGCYHGAPPPGAARGRAPLAAGCTPVRTSSSALRIAPPNCPLTNSWCSGWCAGKVIFPPQYPYKPPSILMLTPNGRFATNTKLCLSMSDFHPE